MTDINYKCQHCGMYVELYSLGRHLAIVHGIQTVTLPQARDHYNYMGDTGEKEETQEPVEILQTDERD